jgi:two-component system chemotaxis response regulator CheV
MEKGLLNTEGNKEVEILEFSAGGNSYGIDINDIREILPYNQVPTRIPNAHSCIEGMIMPRDFLIPIVDISKCLKLENVSEAKKKMLIVTSINDLNIGFHVDDVIQMHRTDGEHISKPGRKLSTPLKKAVVGILKTRDIRIEILDFRTIINIINPDVDLA